MTPPLASSPRSLRAATLLIGLGSAALWLLGALFVFGLFFLPMNSTGEAEGMVIALLPFTVVPAAVLLLLLGAAVWAVQRLRGAVPSSRDTIVFGSGVAALAALALAAVSIF